MSVEASTIVTDDGEEHRVIIDGGGTWLVGADAYKRELHGTYVDGERDGEFFCELEDRILTVDGVTVEEFHEQS
jgi:hypothetical protein